MSIHIQPSPVPGTQKTFSHVIAEEELTAFASLVGAKPVDPGTGEMGLKDASIPNLFMVGIIGGLLNTQFSKLGSECINLHFEFLSPIHSGDRIDTNIELASADIAKNLATYRVDCFNQSKEQVIAGQAVMILPH